MKPSVATDVAQAATAHIKELDARISDLERALARIAAEVTMIESGQQFNTALGLRRIKAICDKR